jgi:plastocyanin
VCSVFLFSSRNRETPDTQTCFITIAALAILLIYRGCEKNEGFKPSQEVNGYKVSIKTYTFNTTTISVPVKTTVKWTNDYMVLHTVTSNSNLFKSDSINSGGTLPIHLPDIFLLTLSALY